MKYTEAKVRGAKFSIPLDDLRELLGLPETATITGVDHSYPQDALVVWVKSPDLPEIEWGEQAPICSPEFEEASELRALVSWGVKQ